MDTKLAVHSDQQQPEHKSFVGLHSCGNIIACVVDDPAHAKDTAKFVASLIRDGLRVEKMDTEQVRSGHWCNCERPVIKGRKAR